MVLHLRSTVSILLIRFKLLYHALLTRITIYTLAPAPSYISLSGSFTKLGSSHETPWNRNIFDVERIFETMREARGEKVRTRMSHTFAQYPYDSPFLANGQMYRRERYVQA